MTPDDRRDCLTRLPPELRDVALHMIDTTTRTLNDTSPSEVLTEEMTRMELAFTMGFSLGMRFVVDNA